MRSLMYQARSKVDRTHVFNCVKKHSGHEWCLELSSAGFLDLRVKTKHGDWVRFRHDRGLVLSQHRQHNSQASCCNNVCPHP